MRRLGVALTVTIASLAIFLLNGPFPIVPDTRVSSLTAAKIIDQGEVLLAPEDAPDFFRWTITGPKGTKIASIQAWSEPLGELRDRDILRMEQESYLIRETTFPGRYLSTFSLGTPITAVPFLLFNRWMLESIPIKVDRALWSDKIAASLQVALSAGLVFLIAAEFGTAMHALLVAFAFAFGTCVWSISSQALWQHSASELFLALGLLGVVRADRHLGWAMLAGSSLGWATWCRHPNGVVVIVIGLYFLLCSRKALVAYVLAGLPFAIAMFGSNHAIFGNAFFFGELAQPGLALDTTGSTDIWQTPVHVGLAGFLLSPSRGLFVFSPFLLAAIAGAIIAWREPSYRPLRAFSLAVAALWLVHSHYFDWWGGWAFGYRQIVDTTVLLAPLMMPVIPAILRRPFLAAPFGILLAWSVFVQVIGAFVYDVNGWNNRVAVVDRSLQVPLRYIDYEPALLTKTEYDNKCEVVGMNIDLPIYRHRIWSLQDNQIGFYTHFFHDARRMRSQLREQSSSRLIRARQVSSLESVRKALIDAGHPEDARRIARIISDRQTREEPAEDR